jgi:hypothetical protein
VVPSVIDFLAKEDALLIDFLAKNGSYFLLLAGEKKKPRPTQIFGCTVIMGYTRNRRILCAHLPWDSGF